MSISSHHGRWFRPGIDWFEPEDIVEIKVLKLPHELVEYGPSGVNGVIVITTKLALRLTQRR